MVALWDRKRLFDRAEALARQIKAEVRNTSRPERAVLLDWQLLYPQPGVPGEGEHA
jgi:hypothetical protein